MKQPAKRRLRNPLKPYTGKNTATAPSVLEEEERDEDAFKVHLRGLFKR